MKGTFFNKPLEWNIETVGESWQQGDTLKGTLLVKNHGTEITSLENSGVGLAHADIKKVHSRTEGAIKPEVTSTFLQTELLPGATATLDFSFPISANGAVTDKKSSYYLAFGKNFIEGQLQIKVEPKVLFTRLTGLLDTFYRFKVKEIKGTKKGVEFKLLPPTSREMANIESLLLTFSMQEDQLELNFNFQVKRLDTSSVTTRINKETLNIQKILLPKEYSLGKDMINQDQLLKTIESVLSEVKLKSVY